MKCSAVCGRILVTGGLVHESPTDPNPVGDYDALVSADLYTLDPGVQRLVPAEGPVTGGTEVAISGLSLAGATEVVFEGEPPLQCGREGSAKCSSRGWCFLPGWLSALLFGLTFLAIGMARSSLRKSKDCIRPV